MHFVHCLHIVFVTGEKYRHFCGRVVNFIRRIFLTGKIFHGEESSRGEVSTNGDRDFLA